MHPFVSLKKVFEVFLSAILILIIAFLFVVIANQAGNEKIAKNEAADNAPYASSLSEIQGKSFYVYDIYSNEVLFSKNEHESLPLASITKLMTSLVALDMIPETSTVTISEGDVALGSGTGLVVGEKWKLIDLMDFSLITSSNDGIHAIAMLADSISGENIVSLMNERAKTLGLGDTVFYNVTGLDVDNNLSGAYSSSYDVSKLIENILSINPRIIKETPNVSEKFISESDIVHYASNTDEAIDAIPSLIASKTGFTDLAGGNLAVVFDGGFDHPIIAVVLGSTESGRFTDMENLVNLSLKKLSAENK